MTPSRVSALAFAAALGFAAFAHAQPAPPAPPPPPGMMGMHHGDHDGAGGPHAMMHGAARMKALHDALNIRPDQEGAFQAFAASMRPPHHEGMGMGMGMMDGHGPGMGGPDHDHGMAAGSLTAPDRADRMIRRFDEHTAMMREGLVKHAEAVKAFYAVLSPEQRHTLDALATLIGHPGGPMGGMPGHGMGPGMGGPMGGMAGHGMGPGHPGDPD